MVVGDPVHVNAFPINVAPVNSSQTAAISQTQVIDKGKGKAVPVRSKLPLRGGKAKSTPIPNKEKGKSIV